jgi:prolyl oligopeptidase
MRLSLYFLIFGIAGAATNTASAANSAAANPPTARTVDAADDAFGLHLPDPYRWMEGEDNPEFSAWLKAQGAYGRSQLDATARLGFWRERLEIVAKGGIVNRLQQPMASRLFFLRLSEGREGVLMVRDPDGKERTLLDPSLRKGAGTSGITGFSVSPDGRHVAINVQKGGGEVTRIEIVNTADGTATPDAIEDVWGEFQASWMPDGSGFVYTQLAPSAERDRTDPMLNMRVRVHRLRSDAAADPVLIRRGLNPRVALEPNEFPLLDVSESSQYAMLQIGGARPENRVCLLPRVQALKAEAHWVCPVTYDDNVQSAALHGDRLYVVTMAGHPNGQVLALSAARPGPVAKGAVLLAEQPSAVVSGLATASDGLYVRRMHGGPDELMRLSYGRGSTDSIALPYMGAIYLMNSDPRAPGLVFTLQGWTKPRTAYLSSRARSELVDLKLGESAPADYSDISAEETSASSADGTAVPLTIIHRRDARPPVSSLAILEGYGGYGISIQPHFDPIALEWVKAGHVHAICHVRGGGENGDRWRTAGTGAVKERGVEDFIGCAQALNSRGWAGPRKIIAYGGSMGGVLIGGAITRDPGLFGAAAVQSGELNPSRLSAAKNGANQYAEVGDPRTAEGLKSLAAMDPYQRIRGGASYPPALLIVGLNDNRVVPWQSGKFGARLISVGDSTVWYRTDEDMGHFTTAQASRAREWADIYAFAEAAVPRSQ